MTRHNMEKMECPNCNNVSEFLLYDTVNVTLNPELKNELLENNFGIFSCPFCKINIQVESPLLYHDMKHLLWFQYVPNDEDMESYISKFKKFLDILGKKFDMKQYQVRFIHDKQHLVEKIRIFDVGYDDRVIECMKIYLAASAHENGIIFEDVFFDEDNGYIFVFTDDDGVVATTEFSEEFYKKTQERYPQIQDSESYFYNSEWAYDIVFENQRHG